MAMSAELAARMWRHPGDEPPADGAGPWLAELPEPGAPILERALCYARAGLELMPRSRTPGGRLVDILTGSPRAGLMGEDEVNASWRDHPRTPAIAVVCGPQSGVLVIDVDQHEGGDDGLATLRALERQHGPLPPAPMVLSPTGRGRHLHLRWPGGRVRNGAITRGEGESKVNLAPGVEVLGDRMAATLPPSAKNGTPYRWSLSRHPAHLPLPPAPEWLLAMIRPPVRPLRAVPTSHEIRAADRYAEAALRGELAEISRAAPGTRNTTLSRSAWALGRLVARGALHHQTVELELVEAGVAIGLPLHEAAATVRAAIRSRAAA
jgi:hypothetical protein